MIKNKFVIFFGGKDWWIHTISTGARFCKIMAQNDNKIIFVNNLPMRAPKLGSKSSGKRYLTKIKSMLKFVKKTQKNIWVFTPFFFPVYKNHFFRLLNNKIFLLQLKFIQKYLIRMDKKPVVFSQTPVFSMFLSKLDPEISIYYVADKYDSYREITAKNEISNLDKSSVKNSDLVITVSSKLNDYYSKRSTKCAYVSHGVDFDLFNKAYQEVYSKPEELKTISNPIIGYFGSISDSNDKDILRYITDKEPDWNIVLIGSVYGDYSELKSKPNIHFIDQKELSEVPKYGQFFDVCIMNWNITDWINFCSPVKAKEYLAMGKPVVSVPIPEIFTHFNDVISIAHNPKEFHQKIKWELDNDSIEKRIQRVSKVQNETWENKMESISNLIESNS